MPHSPKEARQQARVDDESPIRKLVNVDKISLKKWQYDPLRIYKIMTGLEAKLDEPTRRLVPPKSS